MKEYFLVCVESEDGLKEEIDVVAEGGRVLATFYPETASPADNVASAESMLFALYNLLKALTGEAPKTLHESRGDSEW